MKQLSKLIILFTLSFSMLFSLSGCSIFGGSDSTDTTSPGGSANASNDIEISDDMSDEEYYELIENAPIYEEESEDADLHFRRSDELEYLGSWKADSGNAIYLYGNLELNIKVGGRWSGTIVDEDVSGTWKFEDNHLVLESDVFNATLSFTSDNVLILQEQRDPDVDEIISVVLVKNEG